MDSHVLHTIDPAVLGERIMEARRARGLTQETVAQELAVARTTITAMEKGKRRPRAAELAKLAQLFGRSVFEFVRSDPTPSEPSFLVQFRKAHSRNDSIAERDQDVHQLEQLCRWFVELERLLEAPPPHRFPELYDIAGMPPEQAGINVASAERNRLGLGDGPIPDLWGTLESDVGLRLFAFPMKDSKVAGMFIFTGEYGGSLAINANHPRERQRWSLAREYAHFLTDRYRPEITLLGTNRPNQQSEQFAEEFALNFLMPSPGLSRRFAAIWRTTGGRVTPAELLQLSHLYRVSAQAMILRLEKLDLLPRGTWDELKEKGFRPNEAKRLLGPEVEKTGATRLPHRYVTLAVQAFLASELSEGQLAERLRTHRLDAREQVNSLIHEDMPSKSGERGQITFDLNAPLVGV